jgi:hypothetical protein
MESSRKKIFGTVERKIESFFFMYGAVSYCNNADGLLRALGCDRKPGAWLLFFGSSQLSVETALPHNGNDLQAIPAGHAVHMKG